MDPILILAAILLPASGVFPQLGLHSQFRRKILLSLLGDISGIVHAASIIARR